MAVAPKIGRKTSLLLALVTFVLVACSPGATSRLLSSAQLATPTTNGNDRLAPTTTPVAVVATATPGVASTPTVPPTSTSIPATPTAEPSLTVTSIPTASGQTAGSISDDVRRAIQSVVARGNAQQEQAFAKSDPTLMRDTATADYYNHLVQINRDMADNGVAAIKLIKLEWGPIVSRGPNLIEATTFETWRTTFVDHSTEQDRERNVYTLVQENGAWKIREDLHPDSGLDQPPANPPASGTPRATPQPPESIVPAGPGQSHNWSGYAATGGSYTGVTGTWIVPKATSGGRFATDATWVGIGGVRHRDLIQAGTEQTVLGQGQVRYSAWIEILPQASRRVPLTVNPGDSITVSIDLKSTDQWAISFKNNTTGEAYETTKQYTSSLTSAEWVEEAPSGGRRLLPLDNFGSIPFSNGSAIKDGKRVTIAQAGAKPITMVDRSGDAIAVPTELGKDGSSFTVNRVEPNASR